MDRAQVNQERVARKDAAIRDEHIDPELIALGNPTITTPRAPTQRAAASTPYAPASSQHTAAAVLGMSSLPQPTHAGPAPARARTVLRDDGAAINGALRLPPSMERFRHAVPQAPSARQPLREVFTAESRPAAPQRQSHRQAVPFTGICNACNMPGHTARACRTVFSGQNQRDMQGPVQRGMPASTMNVPAGRSTNAPRQGKPIYATQPVVMGQGPFPMFSNGSFDPEWAAQGTNPVTSPVPPHQVQMGPLTPATADNALAWSPPPSPANNEPDTTETQQYYAMPENPVQPRAGSVADHQTCTEEVAAPQPAPDAQHYPTPVSSNADTPLLSNAGTPVSLGADIPGSPNAPIDLDSAGVAAYNSIDPELVHTLVPGTRKRGRVDTLGEEFDGEAQPDAKRARQMAPGPIDGQVASAYGPNAAPKLYPAPVPGPYTASYPAPVPGPYTASYPAAAAYPAPAPLAAAIAPAAVPSAVPDINGPKYNLDHAQVKFALSLDERHHPKNAAGRFLCAHTCRHVCSHACCRVGMAGDWKVKAKDIRKRRKVVDNARRALLTQHRHLAQTPADHEFVRGLPPQQQAPQQQATQPHAVQPPQAMQQQAQQHQQQSQHQQHHYQYQSQHQYQSQNQYQLQDQYQHQDQYQSQDQYQPQHQYHHQDQYHHQYHHQYQAQHYQYQYQAQQQQQQQQHQQQYEPQQYQYQQQQQPPQPPQPPQQEAVSDAQHLQRHDTDAISEDADNHTTGTASEAGVANQVLETTMTDQRSHVTAVEDEGNNGIVGEAAGAEMDGEEEEDWWSLLVNNGILEVEAPPAAAPKRKRSDDDDVETVSSPASVTERKRSDDDPPRKKARVTAHDAAASRASEQNEGSPVAGLAAPTVAPTPASATSSPNNVVEDDAELLRLQADIQEKEEMLIGTDNKFLKHHWSKRIEDLRNALKLRKAARGHVDDAE